ncbi:hypothetical protein RPE78_09535 [Thioclava litoralis]|uniref:NIF system FeS cluster assembly NifU N-terminal domain-containing protein n=1 Tax=Thioclava litoralis TaxID=3076557 RepID=A0ABZ1DWS9_9RHOB|nr:hypothetical protein RPE78_09535 [Thioclava sp. FTW29]
MVERTVAPPRRPQEVQTTVSAKVSNHVNGSEVEVSTSGRELTVRVREGGGCCEAFALLSVPQARLIARNILEFVGDE